MFGPVAGRPSALGERKKTRRGSPDLEKSILPGDIGSLLLHAAYDFFSTSRSVFELQALSSFPSKKRLRFFLSLVLVLPEKEDSFENGNC